MVLKEKYTQIEYCRLEKRVVSKKKELIVVSKEEDWIIVLLIEEDWIIVLSNEEKLIIVLSNEEEFFNLRTFIYISVDSSLNTVFLENFFLFTCGFNCLHDYSHLYNG